MEVVISLILFVLIFFKDIKEVVGKSRLKGEVFTASDFFTLVFLYGLWFLLIWGLVSIVLGILAPN